MALELAHFTERGLIRDIGFGGIMSHYRPRQKRLPRRRLLASAGVFFLIGSVFSVPAFAVTDSTQLSSMTLVGTGDDFATGFGSGTVEDVSCDRSSNAYSSLAASALGMKSQNVSCRGATSADLFKEYLG